MFCDTCHWYTGGEKICPHCGAPQMPRPDEMFGIGQTSLPPSPPLPAAPPRPDRPPLVRQTARFCGRCGAKAGAGRFCSVCGAGLPGAG